MKTTCVQHNIPLPDEHKGINVTSNIYKEYTEDSHSSYLEIFTSHIKPYNKDIIGDIEDLMVEVNQYCKDFLGDLQLFISFKNVISLFNNHTKLKHFIGQDKLYALYPGFGGPAGIVYNFDIIENNYAICKKSEARIPHQGWIICEPKWLAFNWCTKTQFELIEFIASGRI